MENIKDKKLYELAKQIADNVYERHSAYKSMYIHKVYKELGGRYTTPNKNTKGLTRWLKEEWIELTPYLKENKIVKCGSADYKYKVCRPLYRVDKNTPITIDEILEIHNKKDVLRMVQLKENDMDGRIFWKTLKFYPSK